MSEQLEAQYDIYYRVHSARFGWLDWTKNGEVAGTVGYNAGVEAIEIKLYGKGDVSAPACGGRSYLSADQIGKLTFQTKVEGLDWQDAKGNGEITGTTGVNKAIRQLSMNIAPSMAGRIYRKCRISFTFKQCRLARLEDKWRSVRRWNKSGRSCSDSFNGENLKNMQIFIIARMFLIMVG